jgi:RsiW-degrading membrane proteinase PrsW (M82 family)
MDIVQAAFHLALLLCVAYGSLAGGRTGKAGSAIFLIGILLTGVGATMNRGWSSTSYTVLAVDSGCLLLLAALAVNSNRCWPIWAVGFQIAAVATHIATLGLPDIAPKAYRAISAFWSIPILWVMAAGTRKDRQYERGMTGKG